MSYGAHQEAAADCLNRLLSEATVPTDAGEVEQLVACRGAVIDALRDRLDHLGSDRRRAPTPGAAAGSLELAAIASRPMRVLDRAAHHLPRRVLPEESRTGSTDDGASELADGPLDDGLSMSPVEAMGTPSRNPSVELWRGAAVELNAGTHALVTAPERPWLADPAGGWQLLGDAAACVEAVAVLDVALAEHGALAGHEPPSPSLGKGAWSLAGLRMATSQVGRVAGWYSSPTTTDLARPATALRPPMRRGSVRRVENLGDLAAGQRQLALFVQAPDERDSFASSLRSMDAVTALALVGSQEQVCARVRDQVAVPSGGASSEAGEIFEGLRQTWARLLPHMKMLTDADPARGRNEAALWQQREIAVALSARPARPLNQSECLDLASASHSVLRELTRATRRELHRDHATLLAQDVLRVQPPYRIGHHGPIYRALSKAYDTPPPVTVAPQWAPLTSRRDLAGTLGNTPTGRRPSPYLHAGRASARGDRDDRGL